MYIIRKEGSKHKQFCWGWVFCESGMIRRIKYPVDYFTGFKKNSS